MVQPMQMPPILGHPPMPPIHPRFPTLHCTTGPQHPRGQGAVYLIEGTPVQPGMFKRWINGDVSAALPDFLTRYGIVIQNYDPFMLDRIIQLAPIDLTYPTLEEEGAEPAVVPAIGVLNAAEVAALAQIPQIATTLNALVAALAPDLAKIAKDLA